MKIAFVGKGGSGKSTIASLFSLYLMKEAYPLLVVDADINMHMISLLGIQHAPVSLAEESAAHFIREYLRGNNTRIRNLSEFVKTTPPGKGSNFLTLDEKNPILAAYATRLAPHAFYSRVGTYTTADIGTTCYHGHLAIFENILSHSVLQENEWLVADMVAGIDAFANSLFSQFDIFILVVEPTPEGVAVYNQYHELAEAAGIWDRVVVIGNKIADEDDMSYLQKHCGMKLFGSVQMSKKIKQQRQSGNPLSLNMISASDEALLERIEFQANKLFRPFNIYTKLVSDLHMKFMDQDWVRASYGDLSHQVDPNIL